MNTLKTALKFVCAFYLLLSLWYPFVGFIYSDLYEIGYWANPFLKHVAAAVLFVFCALMTWAATKIVQDQSIKNAQHQ